MRGSRHIAESCVCCVFVFLCVLCLSCLDAGRRRMSALLHGCWLVLVCLNLICVCVCFCFSLVFVWHLSLFFSQDGGAIYNSGGALLTFEGSATFTSCSAEASSSSSYFSEISAVSGGEWLSVEKPQPTTLSSQAKSSDVGGQVVGGTRVGK